MENKSKYLAKIKKLLRLAKGTSSPEEAANAIAKAQAYMRQHGISENDAELSEIQEAASAGAPSDARTPPRYMNILCDLVCEAFGVKCYISGEYRASGSLKRHVRFYGSDSRPEIAAYAFDVLSRQMMAERKKYQDKHCKRCKPSTRVARGDQFCEGWVFGARDVIAVYGISPEEKSRLELYRNSLRSTKGLRKGDERTAKACRGAEFAAAVGYRAGKNARLHQGVNGQNNGPLALGRW
ncbi:DUF2786 domain-containing protein [Citrobacter braakii]|uniref:DUF2786 domain-containing protein n=1 Tax=Citrobacter braakii TaxID=57706 RepID=UPI002B24EB10|nr:DUF2786 domain-containing protein [Citrobacter braakii]MEB0964991.1 DUF2786 domain-containing protein [Citrobacter braakii]